MSRARGVLFGVLVSHGALANMAAPVRLPGATSAPIAPGAGLVIEGEVLTFECDELGGAPRCRFDARYRVYNPGTTTIGGQGAFYAVRSEAISVTQDGRAITAPLPLEVGLRLDQAVRDAHQPAVRDPGEPERAIPWLVPGIERVGFTLDVGPGARSELRAVGVILPGRDRLPHGYVWSAIEGRHPWLHAGSSEGRHHRFEYLLAPLRTWAGQPKIEVHARWPRAWDCYTGLDVEASSSGDRTALRAVIDLTADRERQELELDCTLPGDLVEHGGPVAGFGTVTGGGRESGARAYLGWEIGRDAWVLGASAHTNFDGRATLALTGELATPHLLVIPSVALGLGVPVQIVPDARVGARAQGTITFYPVGFSTIVDWFPASGDAEVLLLGRVSL